MIIFRYLFKEVLIVMLAVTLVLVLLFLSNQLVRYLSYAADGKIPANLLLQLMGFQVPYLLALLLPLGLYLGILLTYSRLYADSEIPVLHACGLSLNRLIAMTSAITLFVASIVFVLVLWVNPWLANEKAKGLSQDHFIDTLQPGRFHVLQNGRSVVYVEKISRHHQEANNIFIAEDRSNNSDGDLNTPWTVVSAERAYQEKDPKTQTQFIVSADGARYDGAPGSNAYQVMQFKKYAIRIPQAISDSRRVEQESLPTSKLWNHAYRPLAAGELQWRLSMPLSVFILALLGVTLSRLRPRQGRYTNLVPAILLYIIYVNLLFVARNWVDLKVVPLGFGMWWVHVLMLSICMILLYGRSALRFLSQSFQGASV